jgi:hypothetical protein
LEARPDQALRRPLSAALHMAVRELGHPQPDEVAHVLGVVKAFAQRDSGSQTGPARGIGGRALSGAARLRDRWSVGIDAPAVTGRADSGDIEIDLVELLTDVGGLAADRGVGVAIFIDEMQDLGPADVSALCAAAHEISQTGLPVVTTVGTGDQQRLRVEFVRRLNDPSLTYTVQFSDDLVNWSNATNIPVVQASNASFEAVAVEDAILVPVKIRRYARVSVSQ